MPSRYVTSQLGQLSLASLWGRLIEYQLRLGSGWQLTLCDPMWHTLHLATRQTQITKVLGSFGQLLCLLHTHPFNGALSGTTQVSRYQKGKTNLDFTETRDSEWQWHQLGHMQVCTSLQTDNTPATHHSVFTGRMPFLPPNQHRQSTEGKSLCLLVIKHLCSGCFCTLSPAAPGTIVPSARCFSYYQFHKFYFRHLAHIHIKHIIHTPNAHETHERHK